MDAFSLEELVGLSVSNIELLTDNLYISFEDGSRLNIFNRFEIDRGDTSKLSLIKGERLGAVKESPTTIDFTFGRGMTIRVGRTESAFVGPEAMVYHGADGRIVVWQEPIKRPD